MCVWKRCQPGALYSINSQWFIVWGAPEEALTSLYVLHFTSSHWDYLDWGQIVGCVLFFCHDNALKDTSARPPKMSYFVLLKEM